MSDNKGINDPKFSDAKALLKEDGLVLSVNLLKKKLNIGDGRAQAIMEALKPMIVHTKADDDLLGGDETVLPSDSKPVGSVDSNTSDDSAGVGSDGDVGLPSPVGSPTQEESAPVNTPVSPSQEPTVAAETSADDAPASSSDCGAGSGSVDETVLGVDPMTGEPVRVCDQ